MSFGDKLKQLRLDAGLTQDALAAKIGVQKQTISRYENSEREPNIRTAKRIADALGVSLEELALDPRSLQNNGMTSAHEPETNLYLTMEEESLVRCWREATDTERENVAFILRDYGMPRPKGRDAGRQSASAGED